MSRDPAVPRAGGVGPDQPETPSADERPGRLERAARDAAEAAARAERAAARADALATRAADRERADRERADRERGDLGQPGRPFERHSAFYQGLVGGLGVLTALAVGYALLSVSSVVVLVVVSLFLAAGLNPLVARLERRGLRRGFAVLVVTVGVLAALALFVLAIVPVIADQVASITASAPGWLDQLQESRRVQQIDDEYDLLGNLRDYLAQGDFIGTLFGGVLGLGLRVLSAVFNTFIVVVLTLYFLASMERTTSALYALAPASRRDRVQRLGDHVLGSISAYVSGAFVVAITAGLSSLVFLVVVGLGQYAVALAFVVALLDVIPMIGATLGAVVVSAIGFATDTGTGVACVVFFLVYQQVENYVVYPRVMSRSVDIPGSVAVIAALVGAALLGVLGALLAIPTAAAVLLVLREVVQRRQDAR